MDKVNRKQLWELTTLVSEEFDYHKLILWGQNSLEFGLTLNTFKTSKGDEVVQFFNDTECFTYIGGSSGDLKEWRGNLNAFPLVDKLIHKGFDSGAIAILENDHYVDRPHRSFNGYSRGAGIASVLCYLEGDSGAGFGVPKAFSKKVDIDFTNYRNHLDPVVHVVPFFKTVGDVVKIKFFKNPHTGYGKHL